jgi:hypothetical protein
MTSISKNWREKDKKMKGLKLKKRVKEPRLLGLLKKPDNKRNFASSKKKIS